MQQGSRKLAEGAAMRTIQASAVAGERIVSIARLLFCLAVAGRSTYYLLFTPADHKVERAWLTYPPLGVAILFSVAILLGLGRQRRTGLVLHASVAVDATVAFVALLPNSIWPGPGYQGAPFLIDTSAILLLTMATCLRHSATVVLLAGLLYSLALAGFAAADSAYAGVTAADLSRGYTMYAVLLAAVTGLSLAIAVRDRRLVERAAHAAIAAEQAGQGLRSVLRDHHDLRTAVTSAQINADLLARDLATRASNAESASDVVGHLRDDLGEIRSQLEQVKSRVLGELAGLDRPEPTDPARVITEVVGGLSPRFPEVSFDADADAAPAALVAGGAGTLRRILSNLVVNACEGDGRRAARRVSLRARHAPPDRVTIEVSDDGPGVPAHVLAAPPGEAPSTKAAGLGLGIGLVTGLVAASGGTVVWDNHDGGGTRVSIELIAADGEVEAS